MTVPIWLHLCLRGNDACLLMPVWITFTAPHRSLSSTLMWNRTHTNTYRFPLTLFVCYSFISFYWDGRDVTRPEIKPKGAQECSFTENREASKGSLSEIMPLVMASHSRLVWVGCTAGDLEKTAGWKARWYHGLQWRVVIGDCWNSATCDTGYELKVKQEK